MVSPKTKIIQLSSTTPDLSAILSGIVHVHASCITHDGTMATFMPPLSHKSMLAWWQDRHREIESTSRHIWVEVASVASRTTAADQGGAYLASPFESGEPALKSPTFRLDGLDGELEVIGVVSLKKMITQTGPFRGDVEKLLVSPNHRRKAVARRLMQKLEEVALAEGRWMIMVDTVLDSGADLVYPKFGYTEVGRVLEYGYFPYPDKMGKVFGDCVWLYKDLRRGILQ